MEKRWFSERIVKEWEWGRRPKEPHIVPTYNIGLEQVTDELSKTSAWKMNKASINLPSN